MNINATSSSGTSSAASNGLSGFAGIDTDSMVEKMLIAQQTKINKQEQEKTRTEWKQELYRDVVDKITTFNDKYFSATSSNYLGNVNLYETNKLTSSNAAVGISSENKNLSLTQTVQVASIATASSITGSKVSEGITINPADAFSLNPDDFKVTFSFGIPKDDGTGKHQIIDKALQFNTVDIEVDLYGITDNNKKIEAINNAIKAAAFDSGGALVNPALGNADGTLKVSFGAELNTDGTVKGLKYEGAVGVKVDSEKSGAKALQALGLTNVEKQYSEATYETLTDGKKSTGEVYTGLTFQEDGKTKYASYKFAGEQMQDAQYTINVNLDGVKKSVSFSQAEIEELNSVILKGDTATPEEKGKINDFFAKFSEGIKAAFGKSITTAYDDVAGQFKITTGEGQKVSLSGDVEILGITSGTSTNFALSTKISDVLGKPPVDISGEYSVTINGTAIKFDGETTVQGFMDAVNKSKANVKMSYNSLTDSFSIVSNTTGANDKIDIKVGDPLDPTAPNGDPDGILAALKLTDASGANSKEGTNAVVNIDGNVYQRTTNEFSIGEVKYSLTNTTGSYGVMDKDVNGKWLAETGTVDSAAKITTSKGSTDAAVKNIKEFVEDYNKLIEDLNAYTDAKPTYKDYAPLSAEQKKEMSESEIKNWEEQGKVGLLRNDRDIDTFLQNIRTTLNKSFDGVTLDSIGVTASSNWTEKGKLEVNETALKSALEKHGDKIYEMFRGKDGKGGLCADIKKSFDYTAAKSSANPGTLVQIAGAKGVGSDKDNPMTEKIDTLAEKIKELKAQYDERKARLWAQFNSMETSLARMNSRASFFA
jgi:flagellar hook-associated protein 2